MPELSGELFTPEEVAELLGVPLAQVESWLDLRSLPSIALPEGRRIRRVDLEPFALPLVEPQALDALVREDPSGVCLAFDQARLVEAAKRNERPGVRLYKGPMHYRSEEDREILIQLPLAEVATDLHGLVDGLFPSVVAGLYFSKAWDWSTESEYRFLLRGAAAEFEYIDSAAHSPASSAGLGSRMLAWPTFGLAVRSFGTLVECSELPGATGIRFRCVCKERRLSPRPGSSPTRQLIPRKWICP